MNKLANKLVDSPLTTVDDIFTHLTVAEIQQLRTEYKDSIDTSKQDLFTLVGNKYRDLIKIAEDIDDMYTITNGIDSKLTNLSYKPLNFVNFNNTSSQIKFNASMRESEAAASTEKTKITVLRDLIYNKLIKLDLKIENCIIDGIESPLYHTSNFIYYAKLYYSIEIIFKETLKSNTILREKFHSLKDNFVAFIENELTTYNLFNNSYQTNDKFKPTQKFTSKDLPLGKVLYTEDEIEEDDIEEEDIDDSYENEEFSVRESYNKNTLPIVNYLLTYIILNHSTSLNTLPRIANKFLELRHEYLSELLKQVQGKDVNFFGVFKYLENTATYIKRYFQTPQNELFKNLRQFTKPWIASNIVGFKSWFKAEKIPFNQTVYLLGLHESALTDTAEYLQGITDLVFDFARNLLQESVDLSDTLVIYHNCTLPLKSVCGIVDQSHLVQLISTMHFEQLLNLVVERVRQVFTEHFRQLRVELIQTVTTHSISQDYQNRNELFTKNMCLLMDSDLDQYIGALAEVSSNSSKESSVVLIATWFEQFCLYKQLISLQDAPYSKLAPSTCLSHLCKAVKGWDFKSSNIENAITQLQSDIDSQFDDTISKFILDIGKLVGDFHTIKAYYYFLEVLLLLDEKLKEESIRSDENIQSQYTKQINSLIRSIYTHLIEEVGKGYKKQLIEHTREIQRPKETQIAREDEEKEDNEVSRPTIRLSSLMYRLSRELCGNDGKLFINESFVELKNKWIEDLVEGLKAEEIEVEEVKGEESNGAAEPELTEKEEGEKDIAEKDISEKQHNGSHSNGSNSSPSSTVAQQLFANTSYLLQFKNSQSGSPNAPGVGFAAISHGVVEFYNSNKNIYFPLSS